MKEEEIFFGAADRPQDYFGPRAWRHEEVAGALSVPKWIEKDPSNGFVTYPKRNQGPQSSCVLYTMGKALGVDELSENGVWRELSPRSLYPYLAVPGGGSNSLQAAKLATKIGMTLEYLLPTEGLTEAEAISDKGYALDAKQIALVYKPQSFMECDTYFDTIASIIEGYRNKGIKKVVMISMIGTNNGTVLTQYPQPPKSTDKNLWYHRVPVTDFGLVNGKKFLSIDNSFGATIGNGGQQLLGIEWELALYGGIYTINKPDNWQQTALSQVVMPKHQWLVDLAYGSKGDDVKLLQQALQSLGMFPISDILAPTGNYFGLTQKSVEVFQSAFFLPVTGRADALTRAKLNEIFR